MSTPAESGSGRRWAAVILGCGALLGAWTLTQLGQEPLPAVFIGVLPSLLLAIAIVGIGIAVDQWEFCTGYERRLVVWMGLGMTVATVFVLLLIQYELAYGVHLAHRSHVLVNTILGGAFGGLFVGFYDVQHRQVAADKAVTSQILNTVREVNQRLLRAETSTDLKRDVCQTLAVAVPYVFAWYGEVDTETGTVRPVATAGVDQSYLDEIEIDLTDDDGPAGPTANAVRTGAVQAVQRIATDPAYEPWRDTALEHGFQSSIAVPVSYGPTSYGVLTVYSDRDRAFGQRERRVLGELGESIGYALYTLEIERQQHDQYRKLERKNEQLEKFASAVSHDLRNPLNVAKLHAEMLRDTEDLIHLDDIDAAHERMDDIIADTLSLARTGKVVEAMEAVDLHGLVADCWASVATEQATLNNQARGTVRADPSRLQQLLENLVRNSIEHGSTELRIGLLADAAGRAASSDSGSTADRRGFYVEDDGPGIPPDEREQVFQIGYSTSEDGTGFGLAMVEEIAHAHGWEIAVTGGSEGGARFEITGVDVDASGA